MRIDMDNTICCTNESTKNYELRYLKENNRIVDRNDSWKDMFKYID